VKTISLHKFRHEAKRILRQVAQGQPFVLTYRRKPVARLEPLHQVAITGHDPIYRLDELASRTAEPLDNAAISQIVYGG
jgi:antitoxin (DNA-binding transcriptional repressor) of toxin-antitoxin stability system